jgi:hypothetical protein
LTATHASKTAHWADAYRALCACNLAYGVTSSSGTDGFSVVPPVLPSKAAIERLEGILSFRTGSVHFHQTPDRTGIDAFLCGETPNAVVVAFRGTLPVRLVVDPDRAQQILSDWFNNARAALIAGQSLGLAGYVHQGYAMSLDRLWTAEGGVESLFPVIRAAVRAGKRLLITGHSKGGALAQMAALRLATSDDPELLPHAVHTFAAPRAGNHEFAMAFDRQFPATAWRFEFQDDIVPHLPPTEAAWFALRAALGSDVPGTDGLFDEWSPAAWQSKLAALSRIGTYESAGQLQFIDWEGRLRDQDTLALSAERLEHLLRALAFSLRDVARAHLPMRSFGYMDFLEAHV